MKVKKLVADIDVLWNTSVLEALSCCVELNALSVDFDKKWFENGRIASAMSKIADWCRQFAPMNSSIEILSDGVNEQGAPRTPLLCVDIPATHGCDKTAILYGHIDVQPADEKNWDHRRGLSPWKPVQIQDEDGHRLYGRGTADDDYAVFAAMTSILALEYQNIPHPRCVILIESGEESGSPDMAYYLDRLKDRLGNPSLVVALDSGCGTYDRLWVTSSLRGTIVGILDLQVLKHAVHSGLAGGVVPDTFRIARLLLEEIEDAQSGEILCGLTVPIPKSIVDQARVAAVAEGTQFLAQFPWINASSIAPSLEQLTELILDQTWRPALAVAGIDGLDSVEHAGNVLRAGTRVKFSMRIPPTVDCEMAVNELRRAFSRVSVPESVRVSLELHARSGWVIPSLAPWFQRALDEASHILFTDKAVLRGEGASIPLMTDLSTRYPEAQFLIVGVLGPQSNAHGPDEFLHVDYAKKITASLALMLKAQAEG